MRPMRMVTPEVVASKATQPFVEYRTRQAFGRCARSRTEVQSEIQIRRSSLTALRESPKPARAKRPAILDAPAHTGLIEQE